MCTDDHDVLALLASHFASHLVEDDRAVDDFSISAGAPSTGAVRAIPVLAHGRCPVLRTRSVPRLVRVLDVILESLATPVPKDSVRLADFGAVVRDGRGVLAPREVLTRSRAVERRIERAGAALADAEAVRLRPADGDILVLDGLAGAGMSTPSALLAGPGAYRLTSVLWLGTQHAARERPATALTRLVSAVADPGSLSGQELLHDLAGLRDRFSPSPLAGRGGGDVEVILDALDARR